MQRSFTIIILPFVFCITAASAAVENTMISKSGSEIATGAGMIIQDQWLSYMNINGIHNSAFYTVEGRDNVVLRFDQSKMTNYQTSWSLTVVYTIDLYNESSSLIHQYTSQSLTINYDNASSYKDRDLLRYAGQYYYAKLQVTSVTYSGSNGAMSLGNYSNDIFLDLEQETERYYQFASPAVPPVISSATINQSTKHELPVSWTYCQGAESYDLEWVLVDIGEGGFSPTGGYAIDFRDATRINTADEHYTIPLAYPRGVLIYRVRGVGIDGSSGKRVEGDWSYNNSSYTGLTSTAPSGSTAYRLDYVGLDSTYNWQYSAAFAEDGKRKEMISYFDGSLRNRQTSTILNTDSSALVGETKYDFEGRGALQLMPTPLKSTGIHFYSNFDEHYTKNNFDKDATFSSPDSVATSDSTGLYYTYNASATGLDAFTPNAKGYPFTRTKYKKDGTNRPTAQSGAGTDLKTGSGHETSYFYGTPGAQQELDRLFGNEVGSYTHYKKNMVLDPNGQVSITYLDQEGRTVATALAGDAPANLLAIDFKPATATTLSEDLLTGKNNRVGDALISQSTLTVSSPSSVYSFVYALKDAEHCDTCVSAICQTCKYDLDITITDEDNNPVTYTSDSGSVTGTVSYTNISAVSSFAFSATLPNVGTYTVTKSLKLNEANLLGMYSTLTTAFLPCAVFDSVAQEPCLDCQGVCEQTYKVTDTSETGYHYIDDDGATVTTEVGLGLITVCKNRCQDPAEQKSECDLNYATLAADMSPGGQYFDNTYYNATADSFHVADNGWISTFISSGSFTSFMTWINDTTNHCSYPSSRTGSWTWDSVRTNWKDCFADYLVQFHPEYCHYEFECKRTLCGSASPVVHIDDSNDFDDDMKNKYATAAYYNPTGLTVDTTADVSHLDNSGYVGTSGMPAQNTDPYFDAASYDGCSTANDLMDLNSCSASTTLEERLAANDLLQHFMAAGTTGTPVYLSIWYVLDDPDNIHGQSSPSAASAAAGFTVSNNVLQLFYTIHGHGSDPGVLGGTAPVMTKYQYFVNAYLGIKKLVQYKRFLSYNSQVPTGLKCDPLEESPSHWGWTDDPTQSFQIRYQDPVAYKVMWSNFCHSATAPILHLDDTIVTNIESMFTGTGIGGGEMLEAYRGNCSQYASQWLHQLYTDCPAVAAFSNADTTAVKNYLIEICAHGADPVNAFGSTSCSSCNIHGPGSCVFNSFADVRDCYASISSTTCASAIVYPPASMVDQQVSCSCEKYNTFISDHSLGSASNSDIATAINDFYALTGADVVTATNVGSWKTECLLTSGHALSGIAHLPDVLMCIATNTVTYNATNCSCTNLGNYIAALVADHPAYTNDSIAIALSADFHPATDYTAGDVAAWRTACSENSVGEHTFDSLPSMLKCATVDECTRSSLYSFITNHGFPEPPATYTSPEQTNIVSALNSAYHPAVDLTWTQVSAWLSACSSGIFTSSTFADMPVGLKCNGDGTPPPPCNCEQENLQAYQDAQYFNSSMQLAAAQRKATDFIAAYKEKCLNTLGRESMTVTYDLNEYYYTLYYYDQAGNLIKTVPPQGVEPLGTSTTPSLADVAAYRAGSGGSSFSVPAHKMVSHYWYNSLQQLVKQVTPDADTSYFYYDYLGRLVVSQNGKQAPNDYSYTQFDALGRIYEVGQLTSSTAMDYATSRNNTALTAWVSAAASTKNQVTNTYYDEVPAASTFYGSPEQQNLRGRVTMTSYTDAAGATSYDQASHYSYDEHGNVKTLIQENKQLAEIGQSLKYIDYEYDLVSGNVNKVSYQNRPDAGGNPQFDRFYHQYLYDADNRITHAFTSRDNVIWKKDAKYFYYRHGPLGRTELGDKQVQGLDHVYTLQGWLKGVNNNTLDNTTDPGQDGRQATNLNKMFGNDAFGYTLNYFTGDYTAKKTAAGAFEAATSGSTVLSAVPGLYNGNICMMGATITDINPLSGTYKQPLAQITTYDYDQLNRIRDASSYQDMDADDNAWTSSSPGDIYREEFHYDLNGNIYYADRYDQDGTLFDHLKYNYYNKGESSTYDYNSYPGTPTPTDISNKLGYVYDPPGLDGVASTDIDGQSTNNYQYDKIGNLIADAQESISNIDWSVYGKIKSITRSGGDGKDDLELAYDAGSNRVEKIAKTKASGSLQDELYWVRTYYVRDAQGNVMATYNRTYTDNGHDNYTDNFALAEQDIYGSSRIGLRMGQATDTLQFLFTSLGFSSHTFKPKTYSIPTPGTYVAEREEYFSNLGFKSYELDNHLGNVLTTISDRKMENNSTGITISSFTCDIQSTADYYAFGAVMPGRSFVGSTSYRYGFGDKEKDDEIKGTGNSYDYGARIYDPRLGKWLSTDPSQAKYAGKTPYGYASNSPINRVDEDGADDYHFYTSTSSVWLNGPGGPYQKMLGTTSWYTVAVTNTKNTYTVHNISSLSDKNGTTNSTRTDDVVTGADAGNAIIRFGVDKSTPLVEAADPFGIKGSTYSDASDIQNLAALARRSNSENKVNSIMFGMVAGIVSDGLLSELAAGATTLELPSVAENVLNPNEIHFMQSSIKNATGEFTVLENAEALKSGTLNPEVLKMNVWKDASGKVWTLDHRRLGAFRLSGLQEAPVQWADPSLQMWKMTTTNGGTSIKLKLGGDNSIIIK